MDAGSNTKIQYSRGQANLSDLLYTLSVNFLLYVVLIIVFYMLVRFYLDEETSHDDGYANLPTSAEDDDELETHAETSDVSDVLTKDGFTSATTSTTKHRRTSSGNASFLNVNEWGEPEGTKQEVIRKAIFCAVGLNVTFCIWGLVQERILTQTYNGDFFGYSYGLVFLSRLGGLLLSMVLMYYFRVEWVKSPLWEYSFPSVANMLSSWCQYKALEYVTFPVQMLAKAFKIVPVMLVGKFMLNKSYESYEYVSAAAIGFGLYLFLDTSEDLSLKENNFGEAEGVRGAWCGIVLLLLFLFFDSFTGQWQTRMFQINKALSPIQMMLIMNAFSAVFSFITLVHQEKLTPALTFVYTHPEMIVHLVIFCICSTVGQLFIFYTVKSFGAVVFSIIMAIRILFSTLLSCFVYDHPITEMGFLGMAIVFGAIAYRIRRKTEGKPLIRWRETEEAKIIFHEWHEHLDM
jgi:solute carrier family 35 (adenosine 3'-phospho 5'-phosphosulfate transporter), member B2